MVNQHIDITQDLDGERVVLACFDVDQAQVGGSAHAVAIAIAEHYRGATMTTDDVLALRELTALADELGESARTPGMRTMVMRPARLTVYRDAVSHFVESRDAAEWIREEDRQPLAAVRGLVGPLEDLGADALHAALTGAPAPRAY